MSHPNPRHDPENTHKHDASSHGRALKKMSGIKGSYFGKHFDAKKLAKERKLSKSERIKNF